MSSSSSFPPILACKFLFSFHLKLEAWSCRKLFKQSKEGISISCFSSLKSLLLHQYKQQCRCSSFSGASHLKFETCQIKENLYIELRLRHHRHRRFFLFLMTINTVWLFNLSRYYWFWSDVSIFDQFLRRSIP